MVGFLFSGANCLTMADGMKRVPPNVRFEIDDVESPWVEAKKYDFIMCRYMTASIMDWPKLVRNIYK